MCTPHNQLRNHNTPSNHKIKSSLIVAGSKVVTLSTVAPLFPPQHSQLEKFKPPSGENEMGNFLIGAV